MDPGNGVGGGDRGMKKLLTRINVDGRGSEEQLANSNWQLVFAGADVDWSKARFVWWP
jgi:hypothetical protein